ACEPEVLLRRLRREAARLTAANEASAPRYDRVLHPDPVAPARTL
ncbi:MAG: hypothetical protein AVDCRST_MAG42-1921, partial [uncultured Chthoniobacterales bacterium]